MKIISKKKWEELQDRLQHGDIVEEELQFLKRCNRERKIKCNHKKEIILKFLPMNYVAMMYCIECGYFSAITCTHGGSSGPCSDCRKKLAKKVRAI